MTLTVEEEVKISFGFDHKTIIFIIRFTVMKIPGIIRGQKKRLTLTSKVSWSKGVFPAIFLRNLQTLRGFSWGFLQR